MIRASGDLARNPHVVSMRIGDCAMKIHHFTKPLAWRIFLRCSDPGYSDWHREHPGPLIVIRCRGSEIQFNAVCVD
jgi:hypothetical protein